MTEEKVNEAPAKKETTKEYVVTMPNTLDHKVGDTVQLTELQASRLVNKVRLKDEAAKQSAAGRKSAEVTKLTEEVAKLGDQLKLLHTENVALKAAAATK